MRLLITGAEGFLGKYVVAEALKRGHEVRAVIRPKNDRSSLPWPHYQSLKSIELDLQNPEGISEALENVDAVIHLAAAKEGDYETQFQGTVKTTENLLEAMKQANVLRLIGISSFSVFDSRSLKPGTIVTENFPLEREPYKRDDYARTKLLQERIFRNFQGQVTILRPGIVYGRDNLWNSHLGAKIKGNLCLGIGNKAILPLTYVENCAEAIVISAEIPDAIDETFNIVDDNLPTQKQYIDKLTQYTTLSPKLIPISWKAIEFLANTATSFNQKVLKNKLKLPGIFVPAKLYPRFQLSIQYSNTHPKNVLKWTPKYDLDQSLKRSLGEVDSLKIVQVQSLQPLE
ncbi:MAG: hypothetical protein N5P05_002309 [Chroococcopsis gigantea SAG 12.99]|jgi:nucleoside-diphosphate-sugar epimerase|nr:NAD(P)-dependent oxidoreductase [Chlorogloea purpurea SAG 13.99]MDV3000703.1 hypothetical protein [Chroococcopsis gigantea SAG 12.99]